MRNISIGNGSFNFWESRKYIYKSGNIRGERIFTDQNIIMHYLPRTMTLWFFSHRENYAYHAYEQGNFGPVLFSSRFHPFSLFLYLSSISMDDVPRMTQSQRSTARFKRKLSTKLFSISHPASNLMNQPRSFAVSILTGLQNSLEGI